MLAEVQVAGWHCSPLSQAQGISKELEHFSSAAHYGAILVFNLLQEMTDCVRDHILDSGPLESTENKNGSNSISSPIFSNSLQNDTDEFLEQRHSTV